MADVLLTKADCDKIVAAAVAAAQQNFHKKIEELEARLSAGGKEEVVSPHKSASSGQIRSETKKPSAVIEQPITYHEAFLSGGGQEAVAIFTGLSRSLVARTQDQILELELSTLPIPIDSRKRIAYSTVLNNQDFAESLEDLYAGAHGVLLPFTEMLHDLAEKTKGTGKVAPLKDHERAMAKAQFKYRDSQGNISWHRLTDIVRGTIVYPDIPSMYKGLEYIITFFE